MGQIYALFVGVNRYPADVAPELTGCVNDITAARRLIERRAGGAGRMLSLPDESATVAAVQAAIRDFLGRAGEGDTALFWFSGHGRQLPASGADLLIEATGANQALVCCDGDLLDKRLGTLLERVARRGAQTVAVLDCCFSGGATREADTAPGLAVRCAPPRGPGGAQPRTPGTRRRPVPRDTADGARPQQHLLLAASRLDQYAYEDWCEGRKHGIFTHSLLEAVRAAGPGASYRQLLAAADARVRRAVWDQRPVLHPARSGGLADLPFLGGAAGRAAGDHLLRYGPDGWEVDCGAAHGLRTGEGAEGTEFVPVEGGSGGLLRARAVREERTLVDAVGWSPDPALVHPVAVSALAVPPATVSVGAASAHAARLLREAIAGYGPGGGPSPLLRVADAPQDWSALHVRAVTRGARTRLLGRDGVPFADPLPLSGPADARRVVDCLTHLARWHRLRDLTSGPSVLDASVCLEIVPWDRPDGPPLTPDGSGEIVCSYEGGGGAPPRRPLVSIRLHNRSHRPLWCVLLDLTDRYAASPVLFPGHWIGPGGTGHALDGEPVELSVPAAREAPGAEVRDWLKLVVAETELNTVPFCMDPWDPSHPIGRDGLPETSAVLRLGPPDGLRDLGRPAGTVPTARWAVRTVPLRTRIPANEP
ncbi:caspase family protein [Streptomyces sp. 8L]|uniref:caspase family protein n=1 Tax=Streptomyces sp. 8L TaxID=2877242 RepID=UPI001CD743AC|nr:caspase family protein [Streptomyces sp. 8L]MCA1219541.1 caspase family protein [Streptomyces sp. 8L]